MEIWENQSLESLPNEFWKPIKGYEQSYEISSLGRVKSLKRTTKTKVIKTCAILKLKKNPKSGYIQAKLCKNSKIYMPVVSRLVAEHFLEKPVYNCVANHKDCITWHNWVDNLEWISQSENIRYSYASGNSNQKGERNNNSKITFKIAQEIREYFKQNSHLSQREIGEHFSLKREHIKDIINNKSWING